MGTQENAKSRCFSGFVRVLLCAGSEKSPPVHPSDYIAAESKETGLLHCSKDAREGKAANPGVVARLMGLDSLPNSNWVSKGATPGSVPRSKSVNFMDYLLEFDLNQSSHRRVKTSASFREVPTLFEQKNHDLMVLYWDNESKDHDFGSRLRKSELGFGESKQRKKEGSSSKSKEVMRERGNAKKEKNQVKNKKISKLKNEARRVPSKHGNRNGAKAKDLGSVSPRSKSYSCRNGASCSSSSSNSNPNSSYPLLNRQNELSKRTRNQQSPKKIETEFCSENLSPVSVLYLNDSNFSDYTHRSPLGSKSKWKSSTEVTFSVGNEESASKNKDYKSSEEAEYYTELLLKLCRLTEEDIRKSDYKTVNMYDSQTSEEICLLFEHKILDQLLQEAIHELVE
ncbi:hypothetical protein L6164_021032 [Bauhinia variegata]|uniref:Uncharacterized protein n=1 Tax=Bauhinia variegata TaxID=167791 RepID=A0ACB9MYJ9_BAUVA|nr:hypothetical protein L6164_021032 [Bauhinia variegata]